MPIDPIHAQVVLAKSIMEGADLDEWRNRALAGGMTVKALIEAGKITEADAETALDEACDALADAADALAARVEGDD
jgi:hypothetical protein